MSGFWRLRDEEDELSFGHVEFVAGVDASKPGISAVTVAQVKQWEADL